MAGLHGIVIPSGLEFAFRPIRGVLGALGIGFADGSGTVLVMTYLWVLGLLAIAFLLPNSQELLAGSQPVLEVLGGGAAAAAGGDVPSAKRWRLRWHLSPLWAVAVGCIAFLGVISITRVSEFLYWQF
jgi:hypothetical protein